MKKKMWPLFLAVIMLVSAWGGVAMATEITINASDEFKQEMKVKALIPSIIASGETSAMYLTKNDVAPEVITGVLQGYFKVLGLDENYTTFEVKNTEEAMAVVPLVDRAVALSILMEAHSSDCQKEDGTVQKVNIIRKIDTAYMTMGEGASYLGEVVAMRTNEPADEMNKVFDNLIRNDGMDKVIKETSAITKDMKAGKIALATAPGHAPHPPAR